MGPVEHALQPPVPTLYFVRCSWQPHDGPLPYVPRLFWKSRLLTPPSTPPPDIGCLKVVHDMCHGIGQRSVVLNNILKFFEGIIDFVAWKKRQAAEALDNPASVCVVQVLICQTLRLHTTPNALALMKEASFHDDLGKYLSKRELLKRKYIRNSLPLGGNCALIFQRDVRASFGF